MLETFNEVQHSVLIQKITEGRTEIRFAGRGGQGMIKSGLILAEAYLSDGKRVVQTQKYTAEVSKGSMSDVIVSDRDIDYPLPMALDFLVAMDQKSYDENLLLLKPSGVVIFDSDSVTPKLVEGISQYGAPFVRIALSMGSRKYANMVALGYLASFLDVSIESIRVAVEKHLPPKHVEANLTALRKGYELGYRRYE